MRDELRAGLVTRIVELVAAAVAAKVIFILRRKKRALMVIEPPRQLIRSGIFEIDDRIVARSKLFVCNVLPRLVSEAFVFDLCVRIDMAFVETRKHCCGGDSVKTVVVVQNANFFHLFNVGPTGPGISVHRLRRPS